MMIAYLQANVEDLVEKYDRMLSIPHKDDAPPVMEEEGTGDTKTFLCHQPYYMVECCQGHVTLCFVYV